MLEQIVDQTPEEAPVPNLNALLIEAMPRLRPIQQRVAAHLIQHGHRFSDMTLSELADRTGVSQATVVQMCKALGLSGFRQFRLLWVGQSARNAARTDRPTVMFKRLFAELAWTEASLQPNLLRAVDAILRADQLFMIGSGGSGFVAQLGAESLAVAGHMAVALHDPDRIATFERYFKENTTLFVVSHRGVNPKLEDAAMKARDRRATIVTMTSRPESPLARLAHILLLTAVADPPEQDLPTSIVRAVQTAAMYALIDEIAMKSDTESSR